MSDYTKAEQEEFVRLRHEIMLHQMACHPLMDHYANIAHFVGDMVQRIPTCQIE